MAQDELAKHRTHASNVIPVVTLFNSKAMPPPNSRKGKPRVCGRKVKTGCKTCKLRHVKCDESQPKCQRCHKFGVECDGYLEIKSFQSPSIITGRKILPKIFLFQESNPPPLRYQPLVPLFKNEQDYQYYAYFRDNTSCVLSGGFDTSLWNRVVLQACDAEPSLRQLTISLAALNKESSSDEAGSLHWIYARTQYGKALKAIRESLTGRQDANCVRIAMVAALLIFCFENQYGDPALAVSHIQSALSLLRKQLSTTKHRSYQHLRNISPTADLEFDLVSAFARLDNYILARIENVDPTRTYILDMAFHQDEFDTPKAFTTITEARNYLEHFQFRAYQSIPHNFLVDIQKDPRTLDDYLEGQDVLQCETFHYLSTQLGQWNKAFKLLFEYSRTPEGSKDFLAATILRVQSVAVDLILHAAHLSGSNSKGKDHNGQAQEILSLSRRAIAHPDFRKTFVFDGGILPSLMCVLMTSLERSTREETIRMARDIAPRREGVWDSLNIAEMGERILEMGDK